MTDVDALAKGITRIGVGVMIVRDGCVLMAKRVSGQRVGWYGWIGGKLEFGETLRDGARREAREEAGIELTNLRLLCLTTFIVDGLHWLDIEFLADIDGAEPTVAAPTEVIDWRWYPLDELPGPIFEPAQCALDAYRTGQILHEPIEY